MKDPEEDFIISAPYTLTVWDKKQIVKASSTPLEPEDWTKDELKGFKKRFKASLKRSQNCHCAYCRTYMGLGNYIPDIEHIVPRHERADWMFLPQNLCLACKMCNSYKGGTQVLEDVSVKDLPTTGTGYKIINPYYDNYFDHIELVGGIIYRGKTKKGTFTIDTCHLYRSGLCLDRARLLLKYNQSSYVKMMLTIKENINDLKNESIENIRKDIKKLADTFVKQHS